YSKKKMLFWGMFLQGIAILGISFSENLGFLIGLLALLGFGTALVYPTFLATIAQVTHPRQRAESIGVFRLWRDLGYAFGAVISGMIADYFGVEYAIILIGLLTLFSSGLIQIRMPKIA
ncbi:MAG: MFS transporter, partial [Algoriphagus sp.]|uniref:MFS transporter n=1 Tax=Algoriphagus sp. TaxID=1872435 RepID=UPI0017CDA275